MNWHKVQAKYVVAGFSPRSGALNVAFTHFRTRAKARDYRLECNFPCKALYNAGKKRRAGSMKIHWIRVLVAAVLFEVVLIVITVVMSQFVEIAEILSFVPAMVFVVGFPFGMWVGRKATSGFVLHGTL